MQKYIFVVGGVVSGIGKGITTASVGKILKNYGLSVTLIKIDPYLNVDAGTLRPTEHGEVWVTEDGGEIDQDLGTYERFLNQSMPKKNSITSGQIYAAVIQRERAGEYLGKTVQYVPHIIDEIIARIKDAAAGYDVAIIEIGGTVGDYENMPFLFAAKALEQELGQDAVVHMLVSYLPVPHHLEEMKTKPTQQAVRLLRQEGIVPDFIICRSAQPMDQERKEKMQIYAHISPDHIIDAPDVDQIYQIPLNFERQELGRKLLQRLKIDRSMVPDWSVWRQQVHALLQKERRIAIAIIGKYLASGNFSIADSYVSIAHACHHAAAALGYTVDITWVDAQKMMHEHCHDVQSCSCAAWDKFDGIIVPGGFGSSGVEGKMHAIAYARKTTMPFLGICYGLQLAVVEYARHESALHGAHTTEVDPATAHPVIDLLPLQKELLAHHDIGGSMRLGAYVATVDPTSKVAALYTQAGRSMHDAGTGNLQVIERHRHRYEVNPTYVPALKASGLTFSGYYTRQDGTQLMEFLELRDHPFFVATQAHPEFTSRLADPNPLFTGFMQASIERAKVRNL
jgi:CTP synthase